MEAALQNYTIQKKTGNLGATIEGIDLNIPDEELITFLKNALDENLVIKIRDQSLDRFGLADLVKKFGTPYIHPIVPNGYEDCPEVLELLRKPDDSELFGGESWHSDVTWMKPIGYVSILHAIDLPDVGGDTAFSSTIAAFEALSSGMKELLRKQSAVHAFHWRENREVEPWYCEHPVVREHPNTKQEGLYINRMFTSRFCNMTAEESAPLLNYLFDHMEEHKFTCRFEWSLGDVLIWDNRFTLHYPINDFSGQLRRMIRTSALEEI